MAESSKSSPFACDLAVVIGINQYQNNIPELRTARYDAERLADILQEKYGYDVELFTDKQATSENIWNYLKIELPQKMKLYKENEEQKVRLLFYFAGHGTPPQGEDGEGGHLLPQDAEIGKTDNFLPMKVIQHVLTHLGCHHLLVILDCCYAGAFGSSTRHIAAPPEEISIERYEHYIDCPAAQVVASAAHDQTAIDLFKDNRGTGKNPNHSPFAELLFKALEEEAADYTKDGITIVRELDLYLGEELIKLTANQENWNQPQVCRAWCLPGYDKGEFFFQTREFNRDDLPYAIDLNKGNNPYRGLKSFEEADRRFFFGRREALKDLYRRIDADNQPLTVVLGISGSGKSSLVKAGLIPIVRDPELRKETFNHVEAQQNKQNSSSQTSQASSENQTQWRTLEPIRPGATPFTALARAMLPLAFQESVLNLEILKQLDELLRKERRKDRDNKEELKELFTKWRRTAPEDKLLLVIQHFKCLEDLCRERKEQPTLKDLQSLRKIGLKRSRLVLDNLDKLTRYCDSAEKEQLKRFSEKCKHQIQDWSSEWQQDSKKFEEFIVRNSPEGRNIKILLVIDQFEELITQCKQEKRQNFLTVLQEALKALPRQLRLVLTLRDDFQHYFENSEQLQEYWKKEEACFRVNSMGRDQLRETIEQPAAAQDLFFEKKEDKSLVDQLLDDIGDTSGALPLLSFTLSELYYKYVEKQRDDRTLTWEDYDELGRVTKALTSKATQEYDDLKKNFVDGQEIKLSDEIAQARQTMLRWVMLRMVTLDGGEKAKRRVLESELEYADPETNKHRTEVIDRFRDARLLITGTNLEGKTYVEPAHDVLVREWDKITTWLSESPAQVNGIQKQLDPEPQNKQWLGLSLPSIGWNKKPEKGQERFDLNLQRELTIAANKWDSARKGNPIEQNGQTPDTDESAAEDKNTKAKKTQFKEVVGLLWHNYPRLPQAEQVNLSTTDNWLNKLEVEFVRESGLQRHRNIRLRWRIAGAVTLTISVVAIIAFIQWINAQKQLVSTVSTLTNNSQELFESNKEFDALIASLNAGRNLKQLKFGADSDLQRQIKDALLNAIIWVNEQNRLEGHLASVQSVSFSPNRLLLASASSDNTIRIWDTTTGKTVYALAGHRDTVNSVSFSPDGQLLASGSEDNTIRIWDVATGKEIGTPLMGHAGVVRSVSFSPDGKFLASGSADGNIMLWNLANGAMITTFTGHTSAINSVSFSPDGQRLASGSEDATIGIWDVTTGNGRTYPFLTETSWGSIDSVSFSPDSKTLAFAGEDQIIKLWNIDQGTLIKLSGHSGRIRSVSFSHNGKMLASASWDRTIKLWDVTTGKEIITLFGHRQFINSVSFSSDDQFLASASEDRSIKIWNIHNRPEANPITTYSDEVWSLSFSPNGKLLAAGSRDTTINIWDVATGEIKNSLQGDHFIRSISFSPKDENVLAFATFTQITFWNLITNEKVSIDRSNSLITSISFSPNGDLIGESNWDNNIHLWDVSTRREKIPPLTGHTDKVNSVSFSPDGQWLASGSEDNTIKIWDVVTGKEIGPPLTGHTSGVRSVSFSPDGQRLASGSADGNIMLWDIPQGTVRSFKGHSGTVNSISFSPDGRLLVSASEDHNIILWVVASGEMITTLKGHTSGIVSMSPSANGLLASSSVDKKVILWNYQKILSEFTLSNLLARGCNQVRNYLQNNPNVSESDRRLCDGIGD